MATYYRRDEWVQDAMGNAISGAGVYVASQPANTTTVPPSPLVQLYADSAGVTPLTQPVITDGYGHAAYYLATGTYTVVYSSPQIQQVVLADQSVNQGGVSIPVAVNQGGTGATTAGQALINLGAAASGANVDITSLGDIPNTTLNSTGYIFNSGGNTVQIGNQSPWANSSPPYSGVGLEVTNGGTSNYTLLGSGQIQTQTIGCSGINALGLNVVNAANIGSLRVGSTGTGVINSFTPGQALQIGALGNPTGPSVIISAGQVTPTSGQGLLAFQGNYFTQTTVGPAGSAAAIPVPKLYLQIQLPDGSIGLIPVCRFS